MTLGGYMWCPLFANIPLTPDTSFPKVWTHENKCVLVCQSPSIQYIRVGQNSYCGFYAFPPSAKRAYIWCRTTRETVLSKFIIRDPRRRRTLLSTCLRCGQVAHCTFVRKYRLQCSMRRDILSNLRGYCIAFQLERTRTFLLCRSTRFMKTGFKLDHIQAIQPKLKHLWTLTTHRPSARFMKTNEGLRWQATTF